MSLWGTVEVWKRRHNSEAWHNTTTKTGLPNCSWTAITHNHSSDCWPAQWKTFTLRKWMCGRESEKKTGSYLIGQSKCPPVNGQRCFRLNVNVNQNSLFRVHMLRLHDPSKQDELYHYLINFCLIHTAALYSLTWAGMLRSGWQPGQTVRGVFRSP